MDANRLIPIGAASCYPASLVKNLVRWCQIFEVLQLQPQKRAKRSNLHVCGDSWSFAMFKQDSALNTELARCWVFRSQDTRFHVSMLLSADTI